MEIYIKFILIGLAIAMPVGAITVEMTKQGLRNGFIHGWAVGLGGMTIDAGLILAMYFGFASVLSLPYVQIPLWLAGAGFLAFLGYDSIRTQIWIWQHQIIQKEKSKNRFGGHTAMAYW